MCVNPTELKWMEHCRSLETEVERLKGELSDALARERQLREALKHWSSEYGKELELAERRIASCEKDGDSHGVNFHQGLKHGLIRHDLALEKFKQALAATGKETQ